MNLTYNGLPLHNLGEVTLATSREFEGGESPQRAKVTLKATIDVFEATYSDNAALVSQIQAALKTQHGVLVWTDSDTGQVYLNRTVTVQSDDDPETWGTYHQQANITFVYFEQDLVANTLPATFVSAAGSVTLDHVMRWKEGYTAERFSPLHSQRRMASKRITASGVFFADTGLGLSARRSALQTLRKAMMTAVNKSEGVLAFADFSQTVRVENFEADVDQHANAIEWSLTATYTLFPDESNYATVEWTIEQRENFNGEQFLTFNGKIVANSEAAARTKKGVLQDTILANYGYVTTSTQPMRDDSTANSVDANSDGQFFTDLSFAAEWRRFRADNAAATFAKTGGAPVSFGNVIKFSKRYSARRFDEMRSQRQHATGQLVASGTWVGLFTMAVAARRSALITLAQQMEDQVNGADGTLVFGDFSKLVRVEDFQADINQSLTGIDWSMTAGYSNFPDEGDYATAEYNCDTHQSVEDGDSHLTFSGRIFAPDETVARTKLAALRAIVLADHAFTAAQNLRIQSQPNWVSANGDKTQGLAAHEASDGTTFLSLSFSEEYRTRIADLLGWTMQVSDNNELRSGLTITTYSGTVIASGATADAAYAIAVAKARSLGDGKYPLKARDSISQDQRQTQASNVVEMVSLKFSFEYQRKNTTGSYMEVNSEVTSETFGVDSENISGFVVAVDHATATTLYQANVKAAYAGRLIHNERLVKSSQIAGAVRQEMKLEFSLSVFKAKTSSSARYAMDVERNFETLEISTNMSGSAYATDVGTANTIVDGLVARLAPGVQTSSRRAQDMEFVPSDLGNPNGQFIKLDFTEQFKGRITGDTSILHSEVSEELQYSNVRWVVQPLPRAADGSGGVSVVQDCGLEPGQRVIRGSITSALESVALSSAKRHRALLTGDRDNGNFPHPERYETAFKFLPRTDGIPRPAEGTVNVQFCTVSFTFGEVLPNYPVV